MTTLTASGNGDRLNGWKEIAGHLGKGTRTAQRWEKEYGLPVHRVGREGGEIVFAFRDEIDRWSRRSPAAEALREAEGRTVAEASSPDLGVSVERPRPSGRLAIRLSLAGALAVAGLIAYSALGRLGSPARPPAPRPGPPAAWRLANSALTVFDDEGRVVFRHDFGVALAETASSSDRPVRGPIVRMADIDGDGRVEVLVRLPARRREESRFYCFESDGRIRFVDDPRGSMRFGSTEYGEPWLAYGIFLAGAGPARSLYVSFTHSLWFPARVRRLDPRGRLLSEYWSNGYVDFVDDVVLGGRKVTLVGGPGNDVKGASLAIFDPPGPTGHAPSADEDHRCHGCPPGGPAARLVFPSLPMVGVGGIAAVHEAWVEGTGRLTVKVAQGTDEAENGASGFLYVYYTFDPGLALVHVEVTPQLLARHAQLERLGVLDHAFGARDEAALFPVRLFDATGVHDLARVPVTR
jgi:hypothetical protein